MNKHEVILTALACAFSWLQVNRINYRPFNCLMCMSGWCALIIAAFAGYGLYALLFFPLGIFAGAMLEGVIMKYL
ncbi:hypothetical protein [Mucilaginibacter pedocola]|nr:hypothetical protein [Mucilaginibacter pedocola]